MTYEKNPSAIYRKSFATVERESDLGQIPEDLRDIVVRIIHSCGMTDISRDIRFSSNFAVTASRALESRTKVFCDSRMTAAGIMGGYLPDDCEIVVPQFDAELSETARQNQTTRSATLVDKWSRNLGGSLVVIGNAPTALFRLLEMVAEGSAKPAAVIGFPVGFVGAAESKQALVDSGNRLEFLTLLGRRGGSGMAAAAVNALLLRAHTKAKISVEDI